MHPPADMSHDRAHRHPDLSRPHSHTRGIVRIGREPVGGAADRHRETAPAAVRGPRRPAIGRHRVPDRPGTAAALDVVTEGVAVIGGGGGHADVARPRPSIDHHPISRVLGQRRRGGGSEHRPVRRRQIRCDPAWHAQRAVRDRTGRGLAGVVGMNAHPRHRPRSRSHAQHNRPQRIARIVVAGSERRRVTRRRRARLRNRRAGLLIAVRHIGARLHVAHRARHPDLEVRVQRVAVIAPRRRLIGPHVVAHRETRHERRVHPPLRRRRRHAQTRIRPRGLGHLHPIPPIRLQQHVMSREHLKRRHILIGRPRRCQRRHHHTRHQKPLIPIHIHPPAIQRLSQQPHLHPHTRRRAQPHLHRPQHIPARIAARREHLRKPTTTTRRAQHRPIRLTHIRHQDRFVAAQGEFQLVVAAGLRRP